MSHRIQCSKVSHEIGLLLYLTAVFQCHKSGVGRPVNLLLDNTYDVDIPLSRNNGIHGPSNLPILLEDYNATIDVGRPALAVRHTG
jgi:hypothetical protein